jgi:diacylglycerol O-acyltransferase / wax synthase
MAQAPSMQRFASMHTERLSLADHAWLRMDTPINPMVVTAVATFSEPFPMRDLAAFAHQYLMPNVRFRQRLLPGSGLRGARWALDRDFNPAGHLHHVALPSPGDDTALAALIGDLMSTPLDPARPRWQVHLVDSYSGGSALVFRLHHAIADGVALVNLLHAVSGIAAPPTPAIAVNDAGCAGHRLASALPYAESIGRLLVMRPDPPTPLKGALGQDKRAAWSRAISVPALKAVAHRHEATVNDVFASLVAGGLHRYLGGRGTVRDDLKVRAVVPVNLRGERDAPSLGNRFGLAFLGLPLGIASPVARLSEIARRTRALKAGPQAAATFAVLEGMALATAGIDDLVVDIFQAKATLVLSSVRGPTSPVHIAGRRVRSMAFFGPQAGGLALGVSLLSYAGEARIGIASDARVIGRPQEIAAGIEAELTALR